MRFRFEMAFVGVMLVGSMLMGCASPYEYRCDDGLSTACELSGRYGECGVAPGGCGPVAPGPAPCETCASECATPDPYCGHTVTGVLRRMVTCNAGCGRMYWGEWSYDPPDACDPCNNHGDFVGPQCCPPPCWERILDGLRGVRCCDTGCDATCGIPDCGCDTGVAADPDWFDGEPIESYDDPGPVESVPTPRPEIPAREASVLTHKESSYYRRGQGSRVARRPTR